MFPKLFTNTPTGAIVETKCGAIRGIVSNSRDGREFHEWRGIPFGKPPIGELRFASPEPFGKWESIRDGSKFGNQCPELQILGVVGNEDCLYLNISAPKLSAKNKTPLPVIFYIHGGGYQMGTANFYHANYFMDHDVIFVAANYRLGVFGFLNTGDEVIRGNAGMKDQRLALKWVNENIEEFGGDPSRITIFGESAGGGSIHHLMLSPSTKGLFAKAICMSGVGTQSWAVESTEEAVKYTKKFAQRFNCPTDDSSKIADCLRGKSVKELLTEYRKETGQLISFERESHSFHPSIEAIEDNDAFLTEHPIQIMLEGRAHKVPWLVGVNADEGLLVSLALYGDESIMEKFEANWNEFIMKVFSIPPNIPNADDVAGQIRELYFPSSASLTKEQKLEQYTKLFSDGLFILHTSFAADVQRQFSPVYSYYFSRSGGPSMANIIALFMKKQNVVAKTASIFGFLAKKMFKSKTTDWGVCHTDALCMLFKLSGAFTPPNLGKDPLDVKFSNDMVKLWVDFSAADETRLTFRNVHFQAQPSQGRLVYLDLNESPRMIEEPFRERTDALKSMNFLEQYK